MVKRIKVSEYALAYFWLLPALVNFCSGMASRLLGSRGGTMATLTLYGLLVFILIDGYNKGILRPTKFDVLGVVFVAISIIGTYALFPSNNRYLDYALSNWPFAVLFYFVGKSIDCIKLKHIHNASVIGLCLMYFGYVVFKGQTEKDMAFAYSALPYIIGIVHGLFNKKHLVFWVSALLGIFFLFLLGTRGPLVIGVAYLAFCYLSGKHTFLKVSVGIVMTCLVVYFIQSNDYMQLLAQINDTLQQHGIESYIIKNALMGSTASVDSRIEFSTVVWELLQDNLFAIHGLCGDRVLLNGSYTHNFFSEFLYAYGAVGGSILILFGFGGLVSLYFRLDFKDGKDLLVMVVFAFVLKLLFSGSFVSDIWLYFAVGIMSRLNSRTSD